MLRFEDLKVGQVIKYNSCYDRTIRYELILKIDKFFYSYYNFKFNQIDHYGRYNFQKFVVECDPEIIPICELFED